jgi:hypothetical protein
MFAATALLLLVATACPPDNPGAISDPQSTYKFYIDNHWIPLPEPDSRFAPGAVFTFTPDTGFRWVGNLATCRLDDAVIAPVQGNSGKLTFNTTSDYGASAVLKVKGVTAGPEFSKIKKTTLELDKHGPSSLNLLAIRLWINDPANANKIPQECKTAMDAPNTYIVQEAYSVSKGKYTLEDSTNAKIAIKGLQVGPVNFAPDAHAKPSSDGSLEFDELLYTAVRRVQFANGGWQSLGRENQPDADQQIVNQLPYLKK